MKAFVECNLPGEVVERTGRNCDFKHRVAKTPYSLAIFNPSGHVISFDHSTLAVFLIKYSLYFSRVLVGIVGYSYTST